MNPALIALLVSLAGGALAGLGGKKGETKSSFAPNQLSAIDDVLRQIKGGAPNISQNQNFQTGQDFLQSMFNDPSFFNKFEQPLRRDFEENVVPSLANRFAAQGSGGSLGSTGFRNQLAREGSNLETNLAALRGQMQSNAIPQLLGYSQQPFSNYLSLLQSALTPTANVYQPPTSGFLGGILPSLIGGISQGYGQQLGQSMAPRINQPSLNPGQAPSTY